jgi:uncharacterized protein YkwD
MRKARVLVLTLLLLSASSALVATPSPAATTGALTVGSLQTELLQELNQARLASGLEPLRAVRSLRRAAASHAQSMATRGYFSHYSPDGSSPSSRIARTYDGSRVGETLLWRSGSLLAKQALALWLDSPPHRAVLMSAQFDEIGLAVVYAQAAPGAFGGHDVTIVVADLGAR